MKVLFLDIDGVLNSAQSAHFYHKEREKAKAGHPGFLDALGRRALREDEFCPMAVSNFQDLMTDVPDLKIVVSSTWRMGQTVDELRTLLAKVGVEPGRVIGKTPIIHNVERGIEIQKWLDDWSGSMMVPVEIFVIVDDDSDMAHLAPFHVKTDWCHGLDFRKANEIKKRFISDIKPLEQDFDIT